MLNIRFVALVCFVIAALSSLAASNIAYTQSTQPKLPTDKDWNLRHELFQILLQQNGMSASTDLKETFSNPEGSAIVILGKADTVAKEFPLFRDYIANGGRVIFAVNSLKIPDLATVDKGPVDAEESSSEFEGFSDCIILSKLSIGSLLTKDLTSVVTNITGWISAYSTSYHWDELLNLPERTLPFSSRSKPVCMIGTTLGQDPMDSATGGVIVLADPSVISNGMLWYHDNGHFAARIANWLAKGHRSTYTLISNGISVEDYPIEALLPPEERAAAPTPPPKPKDVPAPKMDTLLALANSAISEMSDADRINQRLQNHPRRFRPVDYARTVFAGIALAILAFFVWMLLRRSTEYLNRVPTTSTKTPHEMQLQNLPEHLKNKIAAETIAKEFSKRWTGLSSESEWRQALEELKHFPESRLPAKDRVQAESILAIAIFGGRSSMTNKDLVDVSSWIRILLNRHPNLFTSPS